MKKTAILSLIILGYTALFLIFLGLSNLSEDSRLKARHGVLHLEKWNFAKQGNVQLNGEWTFYRNQLLTPKEIHSGSGKNPVFTKVPNNNIGDLSHQPRPDSGTYRLVIRTNHKQQIFGVKMPIIYTANKVYINGKLVGQSGRLDPAHFRPKTDAYIRYFPIRKGDNELIIQFANYKLINGWGIAKPVLLGTEQHISQMRAYSLLTGCLVIVPFFIMGLFYLGHYLQMRKQKVFLYFSVMSVSTGIMLATLDLEGILYIPFPWLPFWLHARLEGISTVLGSIMIIMVLAVSYKELTSRKIIRAVQYLGSILIIIDLISIKLATNYFLAFHGLLAVSVLIYATYIFILAVMRRMEGSGYLIICAFSLSISTLTAILNAYNAGQILALNAITAIGCILSLSLLMSQRFARAFHHTEASTQKLIRIDALKDEFIARTAHEFEKPLNGILSASQALLKSKEDRSVREEQDKIEAIIHMCYRLSDLVGDILDLEKISQGMMMLNKSLIDISSLINLELAFYTQAAEKKGVSIENNVAADLPHVWTDGNKFRKIINHLLDNAVKYTHQGKITIAAKLQKNDVEIIVADTGIGIPQAAHQAIFDPIQQADTHEKEGIGLGLSITKKLVELLGGKIWFHSVIGTGSVFHVTVPLLNQNKKTAGRSNRVAHTITDPISVEPLTTPYYSRQISAPTLLVVDDDPEDLKLLVTMLEKIPYNIIAVKNGKETLNVIAHKNPDLVVLDLVMPGMSGFDVCRKIREQYAMTSLPVLMLTAASTNIDKHYAFRSGANDILQKPYNFSEFSARIRGLLLMKNAVRQTTNIEVAFLQSQIRPHFLYDVLNSIIALSYVDVEECRKMIAQFAAYLRGSFDFQNTSEISSFKKELNLVRSYLAIETMRFRNRIQIVVDVDASLDFPFPPLMIQPLVENAIQHGLAYRKKGGQVTLAVHCENKYVIIQVMDDGIGMTDEQIQSALNKAHGHSVGLKSINDRLQQLYGTELLIKSAVGRGTTITLRIPVK
ncbi:ATP-binding protein [Sporolactobacillus shoreicorticis]|uniref:histidine kinase n=1 Tax=Sporolactobacillus shoreicorticis TaxID=1923877 RepID=A0ABW5S743_9BACL|nr:ATP-binding protein [Sporolactobacillus shoreicorticis]MCO7125476.1 ATP-binding protein [Sporolactobacillus shoreicorticis]